MEAFEVEASIAEGEEAWQALLSFVREKAGQLEAHEAAKYSGKRGSGMHIDLRQSSVEPAKVKTQA